ncbi:MAG: M24 family metallopeptidase [Myxococcales bacterium FL481]|nr:MAG: M24 family metallopeptidase [Myxococcales bacterium FL481]
MTPSPRPIVYQQRRQRLAQRMNGGALVLHGGSVQTRSNDTEFRFRPDSDFYYLTGLVEPGAVFVFRPGHDPESTLFVRPRDAEAEVWSGRRKGPQGVVDEGRAEQAFDVAQLKQELPRLLEGASTVYIPLGRARSVERSVLSAVQLLRRRNRDGQRAPESLTHVEALLGPERLVKDEAAIEDLRRAVEISSLAHMDAMRFCRPDRFEYEIEAIMDCRFRMAGSTGPGYTSIVGGGDNATILHYVENSSRLQGGDLLLIDAGCEWEQFTGDITRTFPVNGTFSGAQRELYQLVLAANVAAIEQCRVGASINGIHRDCVARLAQGLLDLGLLQGSLDEIIENKQYRRYYMHRTSHWLGADVHDVGPYTVDQVDVPLAPGHALTIEPGLYVAAGDTEAPAAFRGIGIRIEDDVLVREDGPEVLSHAVPKAIDELEAIVGSADAITFG